MPRITRLCVYCGSSAGTDPRHAALAGELGQALARSGIELVFGGGRVGLMGVLADAVLAGGGRVVGVIPDRLRSRELAHPGASELIVVSTMHERKRLMAERTDAFAILPGGIGTLDEAFETLTWRQLGLHDKPIFLVDLNDYWQPLRLLLDHLEQEGFVEALVPRLLTVVSTIPELIDRLGDAQAGGTTRPELL